MGKMYAGEPLPGITPYDTDLADLWWFDKEGRRGGEEGQVVYELQTATDADELTGRVKLAKPRPWELWTSAEPRSRML